MKKIITFAMIMLIMIPTLALTLEVAPVSADLDLGTTYAENLELGNTDPRDAAISIIKVIMTFLGIVAVLVILLGGFKWMTAGGSEDKVAEARKLIVAGIIGLVIILSAWAITSFVITQMTDVVS